MGKALAFNTRLNSINMVMYLIKVLFSAGLWVTEYSGAFRDQVISLATWGMISKIEAFTKLSSNLSSAFK